jgi:hypothetical protein
MDGNRDLAQLAVVVTSHKKDVEAFAQSFLSVNEF